MTNTRHNLLTEPILVVTSPGGSRSALTLPGVLAALSADETVDFAALQAHQSQAWHAFLVQLAAIAVHRAGNGRFLSPLEAEWTTMLRSLTDGSDEPWCLVVHDLSLPAFMQPPVPEVALDGFKQDVYAYPDELDVLITTRNHDVKMPRLASPTTQHWIYALVTLQTQQGFSGRGNYGIARMNGGFASRPAIGIAQSLDWASRFARDVEVWLSQRGRLLTSAYGYRANDGLALLWLEPWDGETSVALDRCDPFFIEICRRLRLVDADGQLTARMAPTSAARVAAKDRKGDTGDIWTPVRVRDGAGLTVGPSGFSYSLLQDLLFSADYQRGPALESPEPRQRGAAGVGAGAGPRPRHHRRLA